MSHRFLRLFLMTGLLCLVPSLAWGQLPSDPIIPLPPPMPPAGGVDWGQAEPVWDENGDPVIDQPYEDQGFDWVAYAFTAPLVDGSGSITAWAFLENPPEGTSRKDRKRWEDIKFWCNGLTFDHSILSPKGADVEKILKACWDKIPCDNRLQKGDIVVFRSKGGTYPDTSQDPPVEKKLPPKGELVHSMIHNGDGTFSSKNGYLPHQKRVRFGKVNKVFWWAKRQCYRIKPSCKK